MYSIWIDTELIREHNQFSFGSLRTPDRTLSPITGHYQAWCPSWSQYCLFNRSSWHTNVIHWAVVTGLVSLYGMTGYSVDECSCFTVFCLASFSWLEAYLSDRVSGSCFISGHFLRLLWPLISLYCDYKYRHIIYGWTQNLSGNTLKVVRSQSGHLVGRYSSKTGHW